MSTASTFAPRMDLRAELPDAYANLVRLGRSIAGRLDPRLHELVKVRASQLNGCAFCIDMHTKDARAAGESEQRLYALNAWREAPFFSDEERAALRLCEAMTNLSDGVSAPVYDRAVEQFDSDQLAALIFAVATINAWNRVSIATRMLPGSYRP